MRFTRDSRSYALAESRRADSDTRYMERSATHRFARADRQGETCNPCCLTFSGVSSNTRTRIKAADYFRQEDRAIPEVHRGSVPDSGPGTAIRPISQIGGVVVTSYAKSALTIRPADS